MQKWVSGDRGYALSYAGSPVQVTEWFGLVQAQLCGVSGYAERMPWGQHWEVDPAIPLRITTIFLDAHRIKGDAHAEFNDRPHGPDLVP